jgi:hypothetical protein
MIMRSMTRALVLLVLVACRGQMGVQEPAAATATAAPIAKPATRAPATADSAAAAHDAKQWDACGEQFTELATTGPASLRRLMLWSAACCYAPGGKVDLAFARMNAVVADGMIDTDRVQNEKDLAALHGDPRWGELIAAMERSIAALKAPELRKELLALVKDDQAARQVLIEKKKRGEEVDWDSLKEVDEKSSQVLRRAIAQYGWPGKSLVGDDGAHAAWLLVQHADRDVALQKDVLARMKPMVATGEVRKADYAYLEDRVAVAEHRKQRYGTQFKDGEPQLIEDEAHVDERRKEVGLGTMTEYRADMRQTYGPMLNKPAAEKPSESPATPAPAPAK